MGTQIHEELCAAWRQRYVSYSTVAEWLQQFKQGRTSLEDDLRVDQPVTRITEENIDPVRMLIEENLHISIRYIVWELDLLYGTISSIIHQELKMKKLCARWIPHKRSQDCKNLRVEICQENLPKLGSGQWRLCDIVTGDETRVYHRALDSKQSNMSWCSEGTSSTTVIRRGQYDHQNMFMLFFRTTGVVFIHTIETGNSLSGDYCKNNCLKPLFNRIRRVRPNTGLHDIKLHHDNTRPRQSNDIKAFVFKKKE